MTKSDDPIDDLVQRLRPLVPRDDLVALAVELRQAHGGRSFYIKVAPGHRAARKRAAGVRDPGRDW